MAGEQYIYEQTMTLDGGQFYPALTSFQRFIETTQSQIDGLGCEYAYREYFLPIISTSEWRGIAVNLVRDGYFLNATDYNVTMKPTSNSLGRTQTGVEVDGVVIGYYRATYGNPDSPDPQFPPFPLTEQGWFEPSGAPVHGVTTNFGWWNDVEKITLTVPIIRTSNPAALFAALFPVCSPSSRAKPEKFPVVNGIFIEENNYCNPCC